MRIARWIVPLVAIGLMLSSVGLASAQEGGTISGVVTDAETSQPIEGALVEVEGTGLSANTSENGEYEISNVPVGSYDVTASAAGYVGGTAGADVTEDTTTVVDFSLEPVPTGTISGTATDAQTDEAIEGALVEVEGTGLSANTSENGEYEISNVPVGSYDVTASAAGYENGTDADVEVTADATATVDFALQPSDDTEEPEIGQRKGFVGTVEGMTESSFTLIQQGTGRQVTIGLPDEYDAKTPGGPRAGTFEDGARVAVLTSLVGEQWVAEKVLVKPVTPSMPITGVVVDVEGGTVTVMLPDGTTESFQLPSEGDAPATGELVTAFTDTSSEAEGPVPVAKGLVKASRIRERLQRYLEEITVGDGDLPEGALQARARHVQVLSQLLENHMGWHEQVLNRVLERVPDKAKEAIQRAKENAQKARQQAEEAIGRAKGKAGTSAQGKGSPDGQPERPDNKGNQSQGGSEEGGGLPQDKGKGPPTKEPGKSGK